MGLRCSRKRGKKGTILPLLFQTLLGIMHFWSLGIRLCFLYFCFSKRNFSNTNGQLILESQMTMTPYEQVRKERKSDDILFLSIYRDFSKGTFSGSSRMSSRKGTALRGESKVKKPHFQRCPARLAGIVCNSRSTGYKFESHFRCGDYLKSKVF